MLLLSTKIPSSRIQFPAALETHRAAEHALEKVVQKVEKDSFVGWVATRDEQPRFYRPGATRMPAFIAGIAAAFPSMKELREAKALVESTKNDAFKALRTDLEHVDTLGTDAKRELGDALQGVNGTMFVMSGRTMEQIQTRLLAFTVGVTLDI